MSANFTGVTFPNQKVTPAYDAVIRRALLPDGILTGCELSYSGSTLTMTAGQLIVCGRQIVHPSSQNWAVTEATTGYARLVLTIDLTRTSTKDTFDQVVEEIQYATALNGFVDLEQSDINATGSRYQVAACVVSLGSGGITGIVNKLEAAEGGGAGGVLKVTAPAGAVVTVSKDDKNKTKTADADGVAVFKNLSAGEWTVKITRGIAVATKNVLITTEYEVIMSFNAIPDFAYTGDFEVVDDNDNPITTSQDNWKIRLLTSGTLTFSALNGAENGIDVFCVGGGGNGYKETEYGGGGGGGGYTNTKKNVPVAVGTSYHINIGGPGGQTSAFSVTAACGENGSGHNGGNGGSGGGARQASGGSDGGDGSAGAMGVKGKGQGTTTREFGEPAYKSYAGGGSGGGQGQGGGHIGGVVGSGDTSNVDGQINTGGGGAGGQSNPAGIGGSGIVIIRNHREGAA